MTIGAVAAPASEFEPRGAGGHAVAAPREAAVDVSRLHLGVRAHASGSAPRIHRCAPDNPGCDCAGTERPESAGTRPQIARRRLSPADALVLQRAAGNRATAALAARARRPSPPVQRYYIEDCDDYDANQRRTGVGIAITLAKASVAALATYIAAEPTARDAHVAALLKQCFTSDSVGTAFTAHRRFKQVLSYLEANDFTIECEDDCDDANAYVYAIWTDVHMCMNVIKNYTARRFGEILLHEVSHVASGTDDEEYFYPPAGAATSLDRSDALDNADSYEAFAAQL